MKKKYSNQNYLKETPKTMPFSTFVWNITIKRILNKYLEIPKLRILTPITWPLGDDLSPHPPIILVVQKNLQAFRCGVLKWA